MKTSFARLSLALCIPFTALLLAACNGAADDASTTLSSELTTTEANLESTDGSLATSEADAQSCFDAFKACKDAGETKDTCRAQLKSCLPEQPSAPAQCGQGGPPPKGDGHHEGEGEHEGDEGDDDKAGEGGKAPPPGAPEGEGGKAPPPPDAPEGEGGKAPPDAPEGGECACDENGAPLPPKPAGDQAPPAGTAGGPPGAPPPDGTAGAPPKGAHPAGGEGKQGPPPGGPKGEGGKCEAPPIPSEDLKGCHQNLDDKLASSDDDEASISEHKSCVKKAFGKHKKGLCDKGNEGCAASDAPADVCAKIKSCCDASELTNPPGDHEDLPTPQAPPSLLSRHAGRVRPAGRLQRGRGPRHRQHLPACLDADLRQLRPGLHGHQLHPLSQRRREPEPHHAGRGPVEPRLHRQAGGLGPQRHQHVHARGRQRVARRPPETRRVARLRRPLSD